jgi:uroporphyrinogen decarboxylase
MTYQGHEPMTKREVVQDALAFRAPAYVPWAWGPTEQCAERLRAYLKTDDLSGFLDSHFVGVGEGVGRMTPAGGDLFRDSYGVVWDRAVDRDIGTPCDWHIKTPADLDRYKWPDDSRWYDGIPQRLAAHRDRFSTYSIGFSLYERAWTMRGMDALLMDMIERPEFVERFLDAIVEHNLRQVKRALEFNVDAVYFGDDYGMQTGLIMGLALWRRFFKPRLARMFAPVRQAGKYVFLHSCGCVAELFDDLVEIGLSVFNPFQPEIMDVFALMKKYRGRLAFHGGMSVQKTLPFGAVQDVRRQAAQLIEAGRAGGYIFSPSHAVPYDVPPENLLAMVDVLKAQPGYAGR